MSAQLRQAGYSGTPLPKKLGLKDGQRVLFLGLPADLNSLTVAAQFVAVHAMELGQSLPAERFDLVHAFFSEAAALAVELPRLLAAIQDTGMIWISWPKKSSRCLFTAT